MDHPAEDEPHTGPEDEKEEAPDDDSGSAAEKFSTSSGKGKGLTKSKLKGLKGSKKRGVLSMSSRSGDMDETTSYACKARTERVARIVDRLCEEAPELAKVSGRIFDGSWRTSFRRGENAAGRI